MCVGEERSLVKTVMRRKKNWIGHELRSEGLIKDVMERGLDGRRGRGRPRIGMLRLSFIYPQSFYPWPHDRVFDAVCFSSS